MEVVQELNPQILPYWRKDAIRETATGLQRLLDTYDRQAKAAVAEKILQEAKTLNSGLAADTKVLVHVFGNGAHGKVGSSVYVEQFCSCDI